MSAPAAAAADRAARDPLAAFRLDGKVAIVTGASAGLGARFAQALAGAGARVVLAARRAERIEALAAELPDALAVPTDMARDVDVERLVAATVERWGRVDVVVNNAGIVEATPALDEDPARFRAVLDTNLTGPFLLSRAAAAVMREQGGGSIVQIASANALVASRSWPQTSYVASKGGIVAMTKELANQWARLGIRVNAIAPGYFASEMTSDLFVGDHGAAWVAKHAPMGRPGAVHELDGALIFLASDASSYVTGQLLVVDGGWTIV